MRLIPGFQPLQVLPILNKWQSQFHLKSLWMVILAISVALSGCVDSDVGVHFHSPSRGEIIQQIQFGERLQSLSGESLPQWIRLVERQASAVGGSVQEDAKQRLTVRIPFTSSDELEQKFNQFFGDVLNEKLLPNGVSLPTINSHLQVSHSNFLLLERDRLRYNIDLRSLGVLSSSGNVLVSPASLIQLQFHLETPWGARNIVRSETLRPLSLKGNKKLIWNLIPGEQNTLETVFWMPNTLGIGAVLIVGLVLLGMFLKYPQTDARSQDSRVGSL